MKSLYEAYKDKAAILVIYVREAHPANAEQTAEDAGWKVIEGKVFHQPKTFEERRQLAETACTFWELPIPALVDVMEPSIGALYRAWPNRTYLLDTDGKIVYRGVKGSRGVNVHETELELRKLLGITEGKPVTEPRRVSGKTAGRGRLGRSREATAEGKGEDSTPKRPTPEQVIGDPNDKPEAPKKESDDSDPQVKTAAP